MKQKNLPERTKLVFATNNPHKLRELQYMVGDSFELLGLADIGCSADIPETGPTLEGNASLKAFYVYRNYGHPCFADDTGLEVDALGGAPGIYSARYAGEAKDAGANMDKLLRQLIGVENRKARFRTVISLVIEGREILFEGIVEGTILEEKRGKEGFGYDPVFVPAGHSKTFAEMGPHEKNEISHRARAVQKLVNWLKNID
ncbi:MAG: non-canonical purine NTP diphosphatase [Mangrovibacterium sp.]|nr:non-canonical purine NTP diphosphatase [Mangrovibacterium sp.]